MLDQYLSGQVSRVSPEAPVPVVQVKQDIYRLGGAANVAHNISSLIGESMLIGSVGQDSNAETLEDLCSEKGVRFFSAVGFHPTTLKTRVIADKQQIARLDFESPSEDQSGQDLAIKTLFDHHLGDASLIVVSDYGKGMLSDAVLSHIITSSFEKGIQVLVDPKRVDWEAYRGATLISPNFKEFKAAAGAEFPNEDSAIEAVGKELRKHYQIEHLLVTRSEKGMSLISENEVSHIPTEAKEVFDISGAGDTVIAALAVGLSKGMSFKESASLANKAAGIVIAKFGTAVVSADEIDLK